MIYNKEIGLTEGLKGKTARECMVCHYWYLKHELKCGKIC